MNLSRLLPLAFLFALGTSHAQSTGGCPALSNSNGLEWQLLEGPGFTFCKAIRLSDNAELFAVTISKKSPFDPKRSDRVASTTIDGRATYWYRSKLATAPGTQVRETLINIDDDHVAHITLRATTDEQLTDAMRRVEGIRFNQTQLSSN